MRAWLTYAEPLPRWQAAGLMAVVLILLALTASTARVAEDTAANRDYWRDSFKRVERLCKQAGEGTGAGVCPAGTFTPKQAAK